MAAGSDIRLRWVLADPARERAVDALGMSAQADRIAEQLVPQLSGTTNRARYLSFLCWAVKQTASIKNPTTAIHRLEAHLAIEEAMRHRDRPADDCVGIVGRGNATRYMDKHGWRAPAHPERLYKSTAFAAYRPAMRALGLLTRARRPELTPAGRTLAAAYAAARGKKPRCLQDISRREQGLLKQALGLDLRVKTPVGAAALRRATADRLGQMDEEATATDVLERHAGSRPHGAVAQLLHRAYVWELLSLGLGLAFAMLLCADRRSMVASKLRSALTRHPQCPPLGALSGEAPEAADNVVALLRAALKRRPADLGLQSSAVELARTLITHKRPTEFLDKVAQRHAAAKPDGPWITLVGDTIKTLVPAKAMVTGVKPRNYRLDAFEQILWDVEYFDS